jgi:hypothetical protein
MIRSFRIDVHVPNTLRAEIVKSSLEATLEDGAWQATVYMDDIAVETAVPSRER